MMLTVDEAAAYDILRTNVTNKKAESYVYRSFYKDFFKNWMSLTMSTSCPQKKQVPEWIKEVWFTCLHVMYRNTKAFVVDPSMPEATNDVVIENRSRVMATLMQARGDAATSKKRSFYR